MAHISIEPAPDPPPFEGVLIKVLRSTAGRAALAELVAAETADLTERRRALTAAVTKLSRRLDAVTLKVAPVSMPSKGRAAAPQRRPTTWP